MKKFNWFDRNFRKNLILWKNFIYMKKYNMFEKIIWINRRHFEKIKNVL